MSNESEIELSIANHKQSADDSCVTDRNNPLINCAIEQLDSEDESKIQATNNSFEESKPPSIKKTKKKKVKRVKNFGTIDRFINQVGFTPYTFSIIVIFSFLILVDGGEMTVASLLVTKLGVDWNLTDFEKGLMGSCVFIGFFVGTLISGKFSDIFGRKPFFLIGNFMICIFALASAFSPNYIWFALFRGFCGLGVGLALPASAALSTEVCPSKWRGVLINVLALFFPLGEIITALIAKNMINAQDEGWRLLLGFIAAPMLVATLLSIIVRESPRFLANNKQFNKAFEEIENLLHNKVKLSEEDKQKIIDEVTIESSNAKITSNYSVLFSKTYIRLNLTICFILFTCSFIYYGLVYVLPQGIEAGLKAPIGSINDTNMNDISNYTNSANKTNTDQDEVFDGVIYSALSEIPSPLVAIILVNIPIIGRRYGLSIGLIITAFFAICCIIFNSNLVLWASLLKFGINIPFSIGYLYVSEAFPTKIRSIAIGFTNSFTRIGGIVTPLISEWLFNMFFTMPYLAYAALAGVASIAAFFLPIETYGRVLE